MQGTGFQVKHSMIRHVETWRLCQHDTWQLQRRIKREDETGADRRMSKVAKRLYSNLSNLRQAHRDDLK